MSQQLVQGLTRTLTTESRCCPQPAGLLPALMPVTKVYLGTELINVCPSGAQTRRCRSAKTKQIQDRGPIISWVGGLNPAWSSDHQPALVPIGQGQGKAYTDPGLAWTVASLFQLAASDPSCRAMVQRMCPHLPQIAPHPVIDMTRVHARGTRHSMLTAGPGGSAWRMISPTSSFFHCSPMHSLLVV